ncbi:hypothetical protein PR202_gb03478 [Eleusine coracana subsp. coracana]|uniref:Uncharacterized protein n=1 Tax=Eleusine coracana subsp. coracana TaxID=191504 RepID=A0AAV5DZJ1_ELECO|nr:hypothetical protein PR202_gb03478 [Eleusine coracana subsp. coracana]
MSTEQAESLSPTEEESTWVIVDINRWELLKKAAPRERAALGVMEKMHGQGDGGVRSDVTRFRYGDEQHLDEALQRIFQYGLVTEDGKYSLVLEFEAKTLELSDFEKRQAKFTSFFGPGIKAEIGELCLFFFSVIS